MLTEEDRNRLISPAVTCPSCVRKSIHDRACALLQLEAQEFLQGLVEHPWIRAASICTRFMDEKMMLRLQEERLLKESELFD